MRAVHGRKDIFNADSHDGSGVSFHLGRQMSKFLTSLVEKCAVSLEIAEGRCHITGKGLFGILGVVAILAFIVHFAPQLVSLLTSH
jgi:hypothetical protein